ncbi:MAG: glycosyltransferase family 39 protein [Acidobacteriota bacterium]
MTDARRVLPAGALARGLLLLVLSSPVFLYHLGVPPLVDPDEGRNAEVAREMVEAGSFMTPLLNGAPYLDKPPALFWLIALSYGLFGTNEFAARLPSALCALAGILATAWFARRHLGESAGWLAGAVLTLSPLYIVFGRLVIFDTMLTLCVTVSAFAAFEAMENARAGAGRAIAGALFFVAAGIGTMTKGPIGLVAPLLIAVVWAMVRGKPALLKRLGWGWGIPIYLAVALPWVIVMATRHPDFLRYVVFGEILNRLRVDGLDRARPVWFHLTILLPGFFPWILPVLVAGLRRMPRFRSVLKSDHPRARLMLFCAVWIAVLFLLFSAIPSKRAGYLLPCAAPIALLNAALWSRLLRNGRDREASSPQEASAPTVNADAQIDVAAGDAAAGDVAAGSWAVAIGCLILAVLFTVGVSGWLGSSLTSGRYGALLARSHLFAGTAGALTVVGVMVLLFRRGRRPIVSFVSIGLSVFALFPLAGEVLGFIGEERSSREVSRFLEERLGPDDRVICYEDYWPGLNFYLRREVDQVTPDGRVFTSNYLAASARRLAGDPSFRLMPQKKMRELLAHGDSVVYILTPRRYWDDLQAVAGVPLRLIHEDRFGGVFVKEQNDGIEQSGRAFP